MTYIAPSPDEIKSLIHQRFELSRSEAGSLADVSGGAVGKWTAGKGVMPYSVLAVIVFKQTGVMVSLDDWRNEITDKQLKRLELT